MKRVGLLFGLIAYGAMVLFSIYTDSFYGIMSAIFMSIYYGENILHKMAKTNEELPHEGGAVHVSED